MPDLRLLYDQGRFYLKTKKIDYYTANGRRPTINDVTVIIEKSGSERHEIIPGKDLKEGPLRTALIQKFKDESFYFRSQVLTCSDKNCIRKADRNRARSKPSDRNEHHVLLPDYAVARRSFTTDVLQEALNIWIRLKEYIEAKGLSRISYHFTSLKETLSSISYGNNSNLLCHIQKIFGVYNLEFIDHFSLKWFRNLLDSAQKILDAGPALLNMYLSQASIYCRHRLLGYDRENISAENLTVEIVVVLNCSHLVRTASQRPKYSLENVAAKMNHVRKKGQSP